MGDSVSFGASFGVRWMRFGVTRKKATISGCLLHSVLCRLPYTLSSGESGNEQNGMIGRGDDAFLTLVRSTGA